MKKMLVFIACISLTTPLCASEVEYKKEAEATATPQVDDVAAHMATLFSAQACATALKEFPDTPALGACLIAARTDPTVRKNKAQDVALMKQEIPKLMRNSKTQPCLAAMERIATAIKDNAPIIAQHYKSAVLEIETNKDLAAAQKLIPKPEVADDRITTTISFAQHDIDALQHMHTLRFVLSEGLEFTPNFLDMWQKFNAQVDTMLQQPEPRIGLHKMFIQQREMMQKAKSQTDQQNRLIAETRLIAKSAFRQQWEEINARVDRAYGIVPADKGDSKSSDSSAGAAGSQS